MSTETPRSSATSPTHQRTTKPAASLPIWTIASLSVAALSAGLATGLLTGFTGVDATVVTAVVSALLAGIGATAVAIAYLKIEHRTVGLCALLSTILTASIIIGNSIGLNTYHLDRNALDARQLYNATDRHHELLETCSVRQIAINTWRRQQQLDPLPTEAFCPLSFPSARPRQR